MWEKKLATVLVCSSQSLSGSATVAATKGGAEQGRKTVSFGEQTDLVAWIELIAQPKRPKKAKTEQRRNEVMRKGRGENHENRENREPGPFVPSIRTRPPL
ncbi:hypothetical protein NDA14_007856 [Ustilago hordei]|uniref:Uncharacterized protein n=1 Tax=Ustilago hordei TaxID=120017 RepID=I2FWW4_USTHO|nr:uncharacterized protein UHO2_04230 [Ustilago hordei]KAJ1598732.1 hypothetical protein NDA14_007856 [Ustilago hordei]UTT90955.1 hypothetical protein NDA17_005884 [Ustilago hordei]CCF51407.1 uncharacterized protein UHOR_05363 [Ustilago hordei]SYW79587.1 uncharacterized protein UHO2_04230 [Ustilago hordei]